MYTSHLLVENGTYRFRGGQFRARNSVLEHDRWTRHNVGKMWRRWILRSLTFAWFDGLCFRIDVGGSTTSTMLLCNALNDGILILQPQIATMREALDDLRHDGCLSMRIRSKRRRLQIGKRRMNNQ